MSRKKPTAEQVLKSLYDGGVQLRIKGDGRLAAAHATRDGCTDDEKKTIRASAKELAALLTDEATGERFAPALKFISKQPGEKGGVTETLNEAAGAYEAADYGRARWLILCAASEARKLEQKKRKVSA